eukprot:4295565-Amphidinium_carterae.1
MCGLIAWGSWHSKLVLFGKRQADDAANLGTEHGPFAPSLEWILWEKPEACHFWILAGQGCASILSSGPGSVVQGQAAALA